MAWTDSLYDFAGSLADTTGQVITEVWTEKVNAWAGADTAAAAPAPAQVPPARSQNFSLSVPGGLPGNVPVWVWIVAAVVILRRI